MDNTKRQKGSHSLYVANSFTSFTDYVTSGLDFSQTAGGTSLKGGMRITNWEVTASPWGMALFDAGAGSLGMKFKLANPVLALLSMLPPIGGFDPKILVLLDKAYYFADAVRRFAKGMDWQAEGELDPLLLDLDGDGIETLERDNSIRFDHNNNLFSEATGWLSGDDGFLVLDENNNGIIDNGAEMFGGNGVTGLGELSTYDTNADGKITLEDAIWSNLRVWRDFDEDAVTDAGELLTLEALGISSFNLGATALNSVTPQGTLLVSRGSFEWASGGFGNMFDALFERSVTDTRFAGQTGKAAWLSNTNVDVRGFGTIVDLATAASQDITMFDMLHTAAASMTTPKLKTIVAQSGAALGQWSQMLEQTRELTPVLTRVLDGNEAANDNAKFWRVAA